MNTHISLRSLAIKYTPFWIFLALFKLSAGLHYTLLSPYGEQLLPLWVVGVLIGMTSLFQLVLDIPAGHLLDKYGYIKMLKITTVFFILAGIALAFGLTKVTYFITLLCSMAGWLFFGPGVNAYILSQAPKSRAGAFISLKEVGESIGIVLVGGLLAFAITLSPSFIGICVAFLLTIAFILLHFAPLDTVSAHAEKKVANHHYYLPNKQKSLFKILRELNPVSSIMVMCSFSAAFFYAIIWFVVPLLITQIESGKILSLGLGVFDLAVVILGFLLGKIADKYNKKLLVMIGLLLFAITGMLIGFNLGLLFLVLGFLATTGDELAEISLRAWLDNIEKDHSNDGKLAGALSTLSDLGRAIGPMTAGLLYPLLGPARTISIGGGVLLITLISYYILIAIYDKNGLYEILPMFSKKPHRFRHKR